MIFNELKTRKRLPLSRIANSSLIKDSLCWEQKVGELFFWNFHGFFASFHFPFMYFSSLQINSRQLDDDEWMNEAANEALKELNIPSRCLDYKLSFHKSPVPSFP